MERREEEEEERKTTAQTEVEAPERGGDDEEEVEAPERGGDDEEEEEAAERGGDDEEEVEAPERGGDDEEEVEAPESGGDDEEEVEAPERGGDDEEEEEAAERGGDDEEEVEAPERGGDDEEEVEAPERGGDDEEEEEEAAERGADDEEEVEAPESGGDDEEEEEEAAERGGDDEEEEEEAAERGGDDEEEEEEAAERGGDDEEEVEAPERGGDEDDGDKDAAGMKKAKQKSVRVTSCPDRKCVPGIIYLGHIPPRLRPKHLRNMLSVYGEIGRVFLQPEDGQVRRRKRKSGLRRCDFTEGWVEFRDKRVAKKVASSLHNTPMGSRKRQCFSSDLWCIKYLHRFQWTHLSERLAYEQTVLQQRLRTEVSQAKRETNFYLNNVDKSAHLDKLRRKRQRDGQQVEDRTWDFTQRQTEEEIQMKKKKRKDTVSQKHLDKARLIQQKSQSNVSLLAKIFNSSQQE